MNYQPKFFFVCLLAAAALLSAASFQPALAQSAPSLGAASTFSVLGGSAVTCTDSVITGNVGISPGTAFSNTRCTIAGGTPPATDAAAAQAHTALLSAYGAIGSPTQCDTAHTIFTAAFTGTTLGPLAPGVYCFPAAVTFTDTTLTLDGSTNPNGIWIFIVAAALKGNGFQVVTTNGAQPCNVFWSVGAAVALTTSTLPPLFQGTILAGSALGSISITGGSLIGRVLANVAVSLTGTNIHGSCALLAAANASCDVDDKDRDQAKDKDKDKDKGHDKDQEQNKDKDKDKH
jgi:Ice-binding-like